MNYLEALQKAIESLHKCKASHVSSIKASDDWKGERIWDADIELFRLRGHPKAEYCYAWNFPDVVTVLKIPPVDSPPDAVRISMTP